ncbi:MAG: hypothetical protein JST86_20275 [Bacteroidetes bacterium]|nr:hypothetical protein [Bacteroidota bacterium]
MTYQNENLLAPQLKKLQQVVTKMRTWHNYYPEHKNETIEEMEDLLKDIFSANTRQILYKQAYSNAAKEREEHFISTKRAIEKLITPLLSAVENKYGRQSFEVMQILDFAGKIRNSRLVKLPVNPIINLTSNAIYQGDKNYSAMIYYFTEIVQFVSEMPEYSPGIPAVQVKSVYKKINYTYKANNAAKTAFQDFIAFRYGKQNLYLELSQRIKQLKSHTKNCYGLNSPEYKLLITL